LRADHGRVCAFAAIACSELCDIMHTEHRDDALGTAEIEES
jgi:hypothetical protein